MSSIQRVSLGIGSRAYSQDVTSTGNATVQGFRNRPSGPPPGMSEEDFSTLQSDSTMQSLQEQLKALREQGASPDSDEVKSVMSQVKARAKELGVTMPEPPKRPSYDMSQSRFTDAPTGDRAAILEGLRSR